MMFVFQLLVIRIGCVINIHVRASTFSSKVVIFECNIIHCLHNFYSFYAWEFLRDGRAKVEGGRAITGSVRIHVFSHVIITPNKLTFIKTTKLYNQSNTDYQVVVTTTP